MHIKNNVVIQLGFLYLVLYFVNVSTMSLIKPGMFHVPGMVCLLTKAASNYVPTLAAYSFVADGPSTLIQVSLLTTNFVFDLSAKNLIYEAQNIEIARRDKNSVINSQSVMKCLQSVHSTKCPNQQFDENAQKKIFILYGKTLFSLLAICVLLSIEGIALCIRKN